MNRRVCNARALLPAFTHSSLPRTTGHADSISEGVLRLMHDSLRTVSLAVGFLRVPTPATSIAPILSPVRILVIVVAVVVLMRSAEVLLGVAVRSHRAPRLLSKIHVASQT